MARYWIESKCVYMQDGRSVIHRKPGAVVELDNETAAGLGDRVRAVNENPDVAPEPTPTEPEPTPEQSVPEPEPEPRRRRPKFPNEEPDGDSS